jgi:UDP-N-acetylglucosamine--N-acetylmuramyl-(pentapeptide) pyrophosphoryl-undecaprenol N-acetylglucosamine transferase
MMKRRIAQGLGDVQVIWQTGKFYEREMREFMKREMENLNHTRVGVRVWQGAFIERMDLAYAAADVVISRSGAITVSELMLAGQAVVFVPSPNVAEDHQTKNARALVDKGAAAMVRDADAVEGAFAVAEGLLTDDGRRAALETNIRALAIDDAAERVAQCVAAQAK